MSLRLANVPPARGYRSHAFGLIPSDLLVHIILIMGTPWGVFIVKISGLRPEPAPDVSPFLKGSKANIALPYKIVMKKSRVLFFFFPSLQLGMPTSKKQ